MDGFLPTVDHRFGVTSAGTCESFCCSCCSDSCTEEFGSPSECSSSGQRISTERSAIRVTDSVDILSDNIDSLRSAYKDVCATTSLDSSFKANYESVSGAAWQYLGTPQGVYRIFPAHIASPGSDGRCYKYDPRTRYVSILVTMEMSLVRSS